MTNDFNTSDIGKHGENMQIDPEYFTHGFQILGVPPSIWNDNHSFSKIPA
jgi:hypothetical protein